MAPYIRNRKREIIPLSWIRKWDRGAKRSKPNRKHSLRDHKS